MEAPSSRPAGQEWPRSAHSKSGYMQISRGRIELHFTFTWLSSQAGSVAAGYPRGWHVHKIYICREKELSPWQLCFMLHAQWCTIRRWLLAVHRASNWTMWSSENEHTQRYTGCPPAAPWWALNLHLNWIDVFNSGKSRKGGGENQHVTF